MSGLIIPFIITVAVLVAIPIVIVRFRRRYFG
jgi:hypothetical protein